MRSVLAKLFSILWPTEMQLLEKAVAYLGIIGLAIAIHEVESVKRLFDQNVEQSEKLNRLEGDLNTKSLPDFPEGINNLISAVELTDSSLVFICNRLTVGCFSSPNKEVRLLNALCHQIEKRPEMEVDIYIPNFKLRELVFMSQFNFSDSNYYDTTYFKQTFLNMVNLTNDSNRRSVCFSEFCRVHDCNPRSINSGHDLFLEFEKIEAEATKRLKSSLALNPTRKYKIRECEMNTNSSFWVMDRRKIIYMMSNTGHRRTPNIKFFQTEMPNMIEFADNYEKSLSE